MKNSVLPSLIDPYGTEDELPIVFRLAFFISECPKPLLNDSIKCSSSYFFWGLKERKEKESVSIHRMGVRVPRGMQWPKLCVWGVIYII